MVLVVAEFIDAWHVVAFDKLFLTGLILFKFVVFLYFSGMTKDLNTMPDICFATFRNLFTFNHCS